MDADQDNEYGGTVIAMQRPKLSIRETLAPTTVQPAAPHVMPDEKEAELPAAIAEPDQADPLPRPGSPYIAHARQTSRPQVALFLVGRDGLPRGFPYADLRQFDMVASTEPGKGPVILLRFMEREVRIEGRELHSLYHQIGTHRMPWVWEMPGRSDRHGEAATVVTKITVGDAGS
jgi:hypothetical protein